jgi:hypothetical protein
VKDKYQEHEAGREAIMGKRLEDALNDSIERMRLGKTLEECLRDYPRLAKELAPLLTVYTRIPTYRQLNMRDETARTSQRARLMRLVNQTAKPATKGDSPLANPRNKVQRFRFAPGHAFLPVGSLITILLIGAWILLPWGPPPVSAGGTITSGTGPVEVLYPGGTEWLAVPEDQLLPEGTRVRTPDGVVATITLFDGSTIEMLSKSQIALEQLSAGGADQKTIHILQIAGRTWHRVVALVDSRSSYEIRTPSASCAVRGTYFLVDVESAGVTRLAVEEGAVAVTGEGQEVVVEAGFQVVVQAGERPEVPTPWANTEGHGVDDRPDSADTPGEPEGTPGKAAVEFVKTDDSTVDEGDEGDDDSSGSNGDDDEGTVAPSPTPPADTDDDDDGGDDGWGDFKLRDDDDDDEETLPPSPTPPSDSDDDGSTPHSPTPPSDSDDGGSSPRTPRTPHSS